MKKEQTFGDKALAYFLGLQAPVGLPAGVEVLNPYQKPEIEEIVKTFYRKFFTDAHPRVALLGINPGRLGGGSTGISFTDPTALKNHCGIANHLPSHAEVSSRFVYRFIEEFGGASAFYSRFYLGSLYPLALVKDGKNYNYYDEASLFALLKPEMAAFIQAQINFGLSTQQVICMGQKNSGFLHTLNREYGFFQKIHVLDHPRFIMQYKTRQIQSYVSQYLSTLQTCLNE